MGEGGARGGVGGVGGGVVGGWGVGRVTWVVCGLVWGIGLRRLGCGCGPGLDNTKYGRIFNIILIRIIRKTWSSQV